MSLISLWKNYYNEKDISVHCKHINTLLTEIYKTFSGENLYFMISIVPKNN